MKFEDIPDKFIESAEKISAELDESVLSGKGKYAKRTVKEVFDAQDIIVDILFGRIKLAMKKYHKTNENTKLIFSTNIRNFMNMNKDKK